jgi:hypothetical protein
MLGSGSSYPAPFAYFYKDALSGDGMGYRVSDPGRRGLR